MYVIGLCTNYNNALQVILTMLDPIVQFTLNHAELSTTLDQKLRNILESLFHLQIRHSECGVELHTHSVWYHLIARKGTYI